MIARVRRLRFSTADRMLGQARRIASISPPMSPDPATEVASGAALDSDCEGGWDAAVGWGAAVGSGAS